MPSHLSGIFKYHPPPLATPPSCRGVAFIDKQGVIAGSTHLVVVAHIIELLHLIDNAMGCARGKWSKWLGELKSGSVCGVGTKNLNGGYRMSHYLSSRRQSRL